MLAPVMFLVYISDMVKGVNSYISVFADDDKLLRKVKINDDCELLQRDLDKIFECSQRWEMEFNAKKNIVMEMGKSSKRRTEITQ